MTESEREGESIRGRGRGRENVEILNVEYNFIDQYIECITHKE